MLNEAKSAYIVVRAACFLFGQGAGQDKSWSGLLSKMRLIIRNLVEVSRLAANLRRVPVSEGRNPALYQPCTRRGLTEFSFERDRQRVLCIDKGGGPISAYP